MLADNANKALQPGHITLQNLCPRPKNPVIADFFHAIGRADELGSGVRNLYKYVSLYSGAEPVFEEADVFTLTIPLDDEHSPEAGLPGNNVASLIAKKHLLFRKAIMEAIRANPRVSAKTIAERLGTVSAAQVRTQLDKLQSEGLIRREGPTGNGGRWVLLT